MLYFRLFCKEISRPCVKFSRVWTKNTTVWGKFQKILKFFDENSMEKLNFYLFLGKFVAKNRNFGNNIIFLQQFFSGSGWGSNPPPLTPLRTPLGAARVGREIGTPEMRKCCTKRMLFPKALFLPASFKKQKKNQIFYCIFIKSFQPIWIFHQNARKRKACV